MTSLVKVLLILRTICKLPHHPCRRHKALTLQQSCSATLMLQIRYTCVHVPYWKVDRKAGLSSSTYQHLVFAWQCTSWLTQDFAGARAQTCIAHTESSPQQVHTHHVQPSSQAQADSSWHKLHCYCQGYIEFRQPCLLVCTPCVTVVRTSCRLCMITQTPACYAFCLKFCIINITGNVTIISIIFVHETLNPLGVKSAGKFILITV